MRPEEFDINRFRAAAKSMKGRLSHGFSLVSAIFLLVIFAMLGAFMVRFSTAQQMSNAQDFLGTLAYQAAYAGIERGVFEVTNANNCTAGTFVPAGSLNTFTVTVQCAAFPYVEGGVAVTVWEITSTASPTGVAVGSSGFVERRLRVTVQGP